MCARIHRRCSSLRLLPASSGVGLAISPIVKHRGSMSLRVIAQTGFLVFTFSLLAADEKLATLKVGDDTYRNVTVTRVTATDIYFSHSGGIANAKLKNLEPELQKKFGFDPAKADKAEEQK